MADQPVNRREYANWVNANSTGLTGCYWIIPSSLLNVYNVKRSRPLLGASILERRVGQRKDDMENETLKPCPFCGETPDADNPWTFQMDQGDKWAHVVCCCSGPEVRTDYKELEHWKQWAIDAWNERVVPNVKVRG